MAYTVDQVVNSGTQWEYSLSVPIRQLINDGVFTEENISPYVFSGLTDSRVNYIADVEDPSGINSQSKNHTYNDKYNQITFEDWSENVPNYIFHQNGSELSEFTFYQRNVLVAPATPGSTALGLDSLRLVLDIKDIKNWMMDFDTNSVHSQQTLTSDNGTTGNGYSGTAYHWGSAATVGPTVTTRQTTGGEITKGLHVAVITIINGELWFGYLNPSNNHNEFLQNQGFSRRLYNIYGNSSQTNQYRSGKRGMWTQSSSKYSMYPAWSEPIFPTYADIGASSTDKLFYNVNSNGVVIDCAYKYNNAYDGVALTSCSTASGYLAKDYNTLLTWLSWCGLYFKIDNITYKPLITGGVITGYTADMSKRSEFDNMSNVTGNSVPSVPPAPSQTDEDDNTVINTAGAPYAKGLVNYYAMTAGSVLIDHISESLSTWDLQNTGKDLYKNLVSCKLIKPPAAIPTTGSEPFTIYGEKPQYQGADITLPVVSGNPDKTFGPYTIDRKFNDFRDYAPYSRVSIYLPYCGWCDLPSHVIGRSVTVHYYTDIIAATVRAVVFCHNNIIAEAAGVMGLDIPFTADAVGMKQAGVVSGLTAYAGGALQTAAGVAQLVTSKDAKGLSNVFSGGSKLLSAYTQTAEAFNENTTEISGKNGDGCCLSGATNIIIKIIRPKYGANATAPYVPAGFAHSVGFVSNKQVRVGNVSGLLIADNVDTSGIAGATDAERAEIKRVLESGLIVNAAPE